MRSEGLSFGEINTTAITYSENSRTAFWIDADGNNRSITARDGYVLRFHINNEWSVTYIEVEADE